MDSPVTSGRQAEVVVIAEVFAQMLEAQQQPTEDICFGTNLIVLWLGCM